MTAQERGEPDIIDSSRRRRIAAGSGAQPNDVSSLVKTFKRSRDMLKAFSGGKLGGLKNLFSGGNFYKEDNMREVVIQIPTLEAEQNIEIDVTINGKKRRQKYRVEIISLEEGEYSSEDKISVLKQVITEHDKDWKLVQIGLPSEKGIPVMFQKKGEIMEGA